MLIFQDLVMAVSMIAAATGLPTHAEKTCLASEQAIFSSLQSTMTSITSIGRLENVLTTILHACSERLGYLYPSIVLLNRLGDRLCGQIISPSDTWESVRRASESSGIPLDSFLGRRRERRASLRASGKDYIPHDAIYYPLDVEENAVIQTFLGGSPRVTTRYYDLVRPQLQARAATEVQRALGIDSIALLPVVMAERCFGVLVVATSPGRLIADSHLSALRLFASQAALAIDYFRLHQELRDREQQVSLLLKATIDAQEEERERICLEIHDGVAQTLAAAFQYLQILDCRSDLPDDARANIRKSGKMVRTAIREAREVIASLRPAALDALGLVATLRHEIEELNAKAGWCIDFDADDVRFPKAVETALYRILHEAVNNVIKHAHARWVAIRLKQEQGHIIVEVEDDGVGFDPPSFEGQVRRKSVGLLSMRKRVELLQGKVQVVSSPGKGTLVRVEVPIPADEAQ